MREAPVPPGASQGAALFFLLSVLCLLPAAAPAYPQQVSEKKEISVFALSRPEEMTSTQAVAIDTEIQRAFTDIGRFRVIGTEFRLTSGNVSEFIRQIRRAKEADVAIPEEVRLGQEVFTEGDFRELTSSFLVAVPAVLRYSSSRENGSWETSLQIVLTIISVERAAVIKIITLNPTGSADQEDQAFSQAAGQISRLLENQIRKMAVFQIRTGVLEVSGWTVDMALGGDMGIRKGDEYTIQEQGVTNTGYQYSRTAGLVVVKEVQPGFCRTQLLYGDPQPGDSMKEVPRDGANLGIYAHALNRNPSRIPEGAPVQDIVLGTRLTATRGFYALRPLLGIELPLINIGSGLDFFFIPFQAYLGGEYNLYLGRLQLTPMAALAYGGLFPLWEALKEEGDFSEGEPEWISTHLGGRIQLGISLLLSRDVRLFTEAGGTAMLGILNSVGSFIDKSEKTTGSSQGESYRSFLRSYAGLYYGGGIIIKL